MLCAVFHARCGTLWYGVLCKETEQKRDMQLDHLHAPLFVL